jgi:hypothetical protein
VLAAIRYRQHAEIGAHVTPFNRALQHGDVVQRLMDPATRQRGGAARPDGQPADTDHRLDGRLQADDIHDPSVAVAAPADAPTSYRHAGAGRYTRNHGLTGVVDAIHPWRIHPGSCRQDLVADERPVRENGRVEAL